MKRAPDIIEFGELYALYVDCIRMGASWTEDNMKDALTGAQKKKLINQARGPPGVKDMDPKTLQSYYSVPGSMVRGSMVNQSISQNLQEDCYRQ